MPRIKLQEPSEEDKARPDYPYWLNEFQWEFRGREVWYKIKGKKNTEDVADGHRVFMILCNHSQKSRKEVLEELRNATEKNPIEYQGELFWSEEQ